MDSQDDTHIEQADRPPIFAGRDDALARLHQHLSDASRRHAAVFIGRRRIGRTALLRYVLETSGSALIPVYVPLRQISLENERAWLHALRIALADALAERDYVLLHPPADPAPGDDVRAWLTTAYLPEVYATIRPQRQLVLLLDDAEQLNAAVQDARLPDDTFDWLHSLLSAQLDIALTLDLQAEQQLAQMQPLVVPRAAYRLGCLNNAASAAVIQALLAPAEITAEGMVLIQQMTGGEPALLQQTGQALAARCEGQQTIDTDDVKAVRPGVYTESDAFFQLMWKLLSRDERLVLTALSSLLYDDPLRDINTAAIEGWLVETDYPLDLTAINAAVRGLEYKEIVEGAAAHVVINAGLLQKWLLENARLGGDPAQSNRRGAASRPPWVMIVVLVVIVIAVVVLAVSVLTSDNQDDSSNQSPVPTVTLAPGE